MGDGGVGRIMDGSSSKDLEGFGSVQRRRIVLPNVVLTVIVGSICHMGFLRLFLIGHVC